MENGYSLLLEKIDAFIRKYYQNLMLRGALVFLALFLAFFLLASLATYFTYPSVIIRTVLFYTSFVLFISLFWQLIGRHALAFFSFGKRLDRESASRMVGEHFPDIKDKLLNTLQLHNISAESVQAGTGKDLIRASLDQKISELHPFSFSSAVDLKKNLPYIRYVFLPLCAILLVLLFSPIILKEGSNRMFHPNKIFLRPAPFSFRVMNPSLDVMQNGSFVLDIKIEGDELPSAVSLVENGRENGMQKVAKNRFRYEFNDLQHSLSFHLYSSGISSENMVLRVLPKAELANFSIDLSFPSYIGRKPEHIRNTGDLLVPDGTRASWVVNTRNTERLAVSFYHSTEEFPLSGNKDFTFSKTLVQSGQYSMQPLNVHSRKNDTLSYSIRIIPDQRPEIQVTQKFDSSSHKRLVFSGSIHDDYGFSSLNFVYGKSDRPGDFPKSVKKIRLPIQPSMPSQNFFYSWEYGQASIAPGQHLSCYFEISDNDGLHGPKVTTSEVFSLNTPSIRQVDSQIAGDQTSLLKQMQAASAKSAEIKDAAKSLSEKLANQADFSLEDRKAAESIVRNQQELEKSVLGLQQQAQKNQSENRPPEEKRALAEKTANVQKLFDKLLDPKTKELLQSLQRLIDEKNKSSTRESLDHLQVSNKDLQAELQRMDALYKQLTFEQNVQKEVEKLHSLADEQKKLGNEGLKSLSSETQQQKSVAKELAKKQESIKDKFADIQKNLQNLDKDKSPHSSFSNPANKEKSISSDLSKAREKLAQNKLQDASSSQQNASEKMKNLADELNKNQDESSMQQLGKDLSSVRLILENLLRSSFAQEDLMKNFKDLSTNDPAYTTLTKRQYNLREDLAQIRDSMYSLSKRVPQIAGAVNKELGTIGQNLDKTVRFLAERRTYEARETQQYVMTSVNNLAVLLSNAEQQMSRAMAQAQNGGKGQGGTPSLDQVRKMQSSLNQDMQQMAQSPKMGKSGMAESLAKMAARQQAIRESLQQALRENNSAGNTPAQKAMKAMESSENDLLNRRVNAGLLNRQKEIMTRMLEASNAEKEQETDKQRVAKQGKDFPAAKIAELKLYEKQKQLQADFIKTVNPDLNPFYKAKINGYFNSLNRDKE